MGFTDIDQYCMAHKRRGSAIIINNKDFLPSTGERWPVAGIDASSVLGLNSRDGTNLDASRLEGTFLGLGFDTEVYHNRTASQILSVIELGN